MEWIMFVVLVLLAWRAKLAFNLFIMAPLMGTIFGGFAWGVIGMILGTMLSFTWLGVFIVLVTICAALMSET